VVTGTTFHGGADSFAEEFLLADLGAGEGEGALAATTFGGHEEVTGGTGVEVTGGCTGVAAGKEFGACLFADGDGILAGCSLDEVCDEGFSTGTEFDVFGGARTGYCLRILWVTSFLARMNSTVEFPVFSSYLKRME
jgi:hypothetical protein